MRQPARSTLFPMLLLLPLLLLLPGCAVNPATAPPSPAPLDLSGDWHIQSHPIPSPTSGPVGVDMDGFLTFQGSQVTGTFRFVNFATAITFPSVCPLAVVTVTGTVNSKNVLTLTSAPFSGSVISVQLTLPASASYVTQSAGTIAVSGPCSFASFAADGFHLPPVTGTYTGTLSAIAGAPNLATGSAALTLTVVESSTPTVDGQLPATATLQFSAGSCSLSVALVGAVDGLTLQLAPAAGPPLGVPFGWPLVIMTPDSAAQNTLLGSVEFNGAPCSPAAPPPAPLALYAYTGTLAKQ